MQIPGSLPDPFQVSFCGFGDTDMTIMGVKFAGRVHWKSFSSRFFSRTCVDVCEVEDKKDRKMATPVRDGKGAE